MQLWILQALCLQEVSSTKRQCCHEWRETGLTWQNWQPSLKNILEKHSPFPEGKALRNIIMRINVDMDVNVQDLFSAVKETVTHMEGQAIFSYTTNGRLK